MEQLSGILIFSGILMGIQQNEYEKMTILLYASI